MQPVTVPTCGAEDTLFPRGEGRARLQEALPISAVHASLCVLTLGLCKGNALNFTESEVCMKKSCGVTGKCFAVLCFFLPMSSSGEKVTAQVRE